MSSQFHSGRLYGRSKMGAPLCHQWRDGVCSRENYCFKRHFYNETDIKKPASLPSSKYSVESSFTFSSPLVVKTKTVTESRRKEEVDLETGRRRSWIEDTSRDLIDITGHASPVVAKQRVSRINDTPVRKLEVPLNNINKVDDCSLQDEGHDKTLTVEANEKGTNTTKNDVNSLGQTASVKFGKIYVSAPLALKPFEKYLNTEQIHGHFEQFGRIVAIDHPIDVVSRQKEGFFFVTFEDDNISKNLISVGSTIIKGIKLIIKPAFVDYGKIFVGVPFALKPLDNFISSEEIYGHFGQFGNIISIYQPINRATQQKEGYFFVTFNNEEVSNNLINEGSTFINGFKLKIEKAFWKERNKFENKSAGISVGHDTRRCDEIGFNSDQGGRFKTEDIGFGFDLSRRKASTGGGTFGGRINHGGEYDRYGGGGRGASSSFSGGYGVGHEGLGGYRGAFSRTYNSVYQMVQEQCFVRERMRSRYKMGNVFNRSEGCRYMPY